MRARGSRHGRIAPITTVNMMSMAARGRSSAEPKISEAYHIIIIIIDKG